MHKSKFYHQSLFKWNSLYMPFHLHLPLTSHLAQSFITEVQQPFLQLNSINSMEREPLVQNTEQDRILNTVFKHINSVKVEPLAQNIEQDKILSTVFKHINSVEIEPLVQNIEQDSIIVTVLKVTNLAASNQDIYVQVSTNNQYGDRYSYESNPGKKTRLASREKGEWNESFFYSTFDLVDDNLTFILKQRDGTELGRATERNVKFWKRQQTTEKIVEIKFNETKFVGNLLVRVDFKENQNLIGGIKMPDLSLAPKFPYEPKYNAIDGYNPEFKTYRANCFSFFDGDVVPGFDHIDIYPPKFKHPKDINPHKSKGSKDIQ